MKAQLSANPKKVSTVIMNGQLYEGTIAEYFAGTAKPINPRPNMETATRTDRPSEESGEAEEVKK